MEIKLGATVSYFLWSLLAGAGAALAYDLLRVARRIYRVSVFRINFEDCCFIALCGGLLFWMAYDKNGGQLRWQGFLGSGLGFGMYRLLLKDGMVRVLTGVYTMTVRLCIRVVTILLFPVQVVYKVLAKPFLVVGWYSRQQIQRTGSKLRMQQEKAKIRKRTRKAAFKQRRKSRPEQEQ